MEKKVIRIPVKYTSQTINRLINSSEETHPVSCFYNQNEEFFFELEHPITIPSFPIHHDIKQDQPDKNYTNALSLSMQKIAQAAPQVFRGLTWFFNPADILKPAFFQVYRIREERYLYLLLLDIAPHPRETEIIRSGDNDRTPEYRTKRIFCSAFFLPLASVEKSKNQNLQFNIDQEISQTWIGETGRGYFVQGIWIDREITRFFSKLFLPGTKKHYPYYPFSCKYKTISHETISLDPEGRNRSVLLFRQAVPFLRKNLTEIQNAVKKKSFTTELPEFHRLRKQVPPRWFDQWEYFQVKAYLNANEQKEYRIELEN